MLKKIITTIFKILKRLGSKVKSFLKHVKKASVKHVKKIWKRVKTNYQIRIRNKILFILEPKRLGIDTKKIAFEAYSGKEYSCNPKAIYEYMVNHSKYDEYSFVWAFNSPEEFAYLRKNPRTKLVKRNSKEYVKEFATSKFLIFNIHYMPPYVIPKKGQVLLNTWHGKPLKKIGFSIDADVLGSKSKKETLRVFKKAGKTASRILVPSPVFYDIMRDAFAIPEKNWAKKAVVAGYSRNEFLFTYTDEDVKRVKAKLHIPDNKKIILYAPTWRVTNYSQKDAAYVYKSHLDFSNLKSKLGNDYVILFRAHNNEAKTVNFSHLSDFVIDATDISDVNELYIISDLMISDYSGTIFDYANLKRPIILYMYDKEEYREKVGFNFPLEILPGKIVTTEEELADSIADSIQYFSFDEKYQQFLDICNSCDGIGSISSLLDQLGVNVE